VDHLLHHLLRTAAGSHPDGPAVVDGARSLTYGELESRSNRIAALLVDRGVRRGDRVALYLDKSADALAGIYGVLKSGAVYVPLDPQAPITRLAYVARDCDATVLLSGVEKAGSWGSLVRAGAPLRTIVSMNTLEDVASDVERPSGVEILTGRAIEDQEVSTLARDGIDLDLAYILYTSGSTGAPKGVKLSHRNALAFVGWAAELCGVGPDDRLSSHAPLHFDLSIFDLFAAARGAASVALVPRDALVFPVETARFIRDARISIWYSVPSALTMLFLRGGVDGPDFPSLRIVLFAGEVFPTKYLRGLMELIPQAAFVNLYGPTETNVCTFYRVPPIDPGSTSPIPIGLPIDNVEVIVADEDGTPVRDGDVGEVWVRGATVMQGYWGDSARTEQALAADPQGRGGRDPFYRTGDLARRDRDGNLLLLGRRDDQIKSRGYRIELGEVEAAIYAHPSVVECAVTAVPDELITNRIHAYVVARDGLGADDLTRFCAERIPHYMIPERFDFRDELPKTSTGKVDRQLLTAG
jgi:amino acid adenylation domain-containing protein